MAPSFASGGLVVRFRHDAPERGVSVSQKRAPVQMDGRQWAGSDLVAMGGIRCGLSADC